MPPMRMIFGILIVCSADARNEDGNVRLEKSKRGSRNATERSATTPEIHKPGRTFIQKMGHHFRLHIVIHVWLLSTPIQGYGLEKHGEESGQQEAQKW